MSPYVVGLFALAIASSSTMAIAQKSLIGYSSYRTYIVANFVMLLVAV